MGVAIKRKTKRGLLKTFKAVPKGGIKYGYSDQENMVIYPDVRPEYGGDDVTPPTVTEVAIRNNFGVSPDPFDPDKPGIPARPFMEIGRDAAVKKAIKFQLKATKSLLDGKITEETYVNAIGEIIVASYKKTIVDVKEPPNSAKTVRIKESDNPLIDTGLMKNTFSFWPVKKVK